MIFFSHAVRKIKHTVVLIFILKSYIWVLSRIMCQCYNKRKMMDIFLIAASAVCLIVGLLGCVLPVLPGPPIAYVGLLLLHFTDKVQYSATQLLVWLLLVVIVQVLDYFIPMLGSKYSGGSKWGSWGCFIGTILGLFFLPWGIIIGPFLGAFIGELIGDKELRQALKSGIGSLLGFLFGTVLKLMLCGYFCYQFIMGLFFN